MTGPPAPQCREDGRLVDWDGLEAVPPSLSFSLWCGDRCWDGKWADAGVPFLGPSVSGKSVSVQMGSLSSVCGRATVGSGFGDEWTMVEGVIG
jgi:hypothetical protein